MNTYLFARPNGSTLGVAGVGVNARTLKAARHYMRLSAYVYIGKLTAANAGHDYSNWWLVSAEEKAA